MNLPAAAQTAVILIGLWRAPQYIAFLLSLCAALPFMWLTPRDIHPVPTSYLSHVPPGESWEQGLWLPAVICLIPLQAVAALEALFGFGRRYRFAPSVAIAVAIFAGTAVIAFVVRPQGDTVGQVVQVARYQRVGTCVFLLLGCGWYASVAARDLLLRPEGAHLLLLAAWSVTWMIPIIRPIPPTWAEWLRTDWMIVARCAILMVWVGTVAMRRKDG